MKEKDQTILSKLWAYLIIITHQIVFVVKIQFLLAIKMIKVSNLVGFLDCVTLGFMEEIVPQ